MPLLRQASSHSVSLVPCDSDQAGTYIHDPENLHLVLQTDDSDPPDAYTAVVPDAEAGPGEQYYPIVPTAVRTLSNTWCLVPGNRIFGGTVIFFFSDNDK